MASAADAVLLRLRFEVGQRPVDTAGGGAQALADPSPESSLQGFGSPFVVDLPCASELKMVHRDDEILNALLASPCRLRLSRELERVGVAPDREKAVAPQPDVEGGHNLLPIAVQLPL